MNRKMLKILVLLCTLVIGSQQIVYADLTIIETPLNYVNPLILVAIFIGISVLVVISISFLAALSSKGLAQNNNGDIDERKYQTGKKEFENFFYFLVITILAIVLGISYQYDNMRTGVFLCCFTFPFIALFIRIFSRKISNVLCIAFIAVFAIAALLYAIDNYESFIFNRQFEKYIMDGKVVEGDIGKLINTVIKSNKASIRKVEIIRLRKKYSTEDELNELLKNLDMDFPYYINISKEGKFINELEIKNYRISSGIEGFNSAFTSYEGVQTGSQVKALINRLIANANTYEEEPTKIPALSYNAGIDEDLNNNGRPEVDKHAWGVKYEDKTDGYLNYLSSVSKGLNLKHRYNVVITISEHEIVSGITINYDSESKEENFTVSNASNAVNGLASTTGIDIEYDE